MEKYCQTCNKQLELVKGVEPWNIDYMMCPICNGTYNIFDLEKCKCKYAHQDGICRWPTLEGRLKHSLTTEKDALIQLQKISPSIMTEYALKKLEKYLEEDEKLQRAAKKVQAAVDVSPKSITFEEAKKQVDSFKPV